MADVAPPTHNPQSEAIRVAFLQRLTELEHTVNRITANPTDTHPLEQLGDSVDDFLRQLYNHGHAFTPADFTALSTRCSHLQVRVRTSYQAAIDSSHSGQPFVAYRARTGGRGRPAVVIDPNFLRQAYPARNVSQLARFLGCSPGVVRSHLLALGLVQPGRNPFPAPEDDATTPAANADEPPPLLPIHPVPPLHSASNSQPHSRPDMPGLETAPAAPTLHSVHTRPLPLNDPTRPSSAWSNEDIDEAILSLRVSYPTAGIAYLESMLRLLGYPLSRQAISDSLKRLDPGGRIFERVRIERRTYWVPGPNALWHHDGQHRLIRWKIILHGFIDGYSRLITGLRASNNNYGSTVLDIFLQGARVFGVPSRLRGDHGVENIEVATWMEMHKGVRRGSYIWGRSVHNVRIERLWVETTNKFMTRWYKFFYKLEEEHGLDPDNAHHLWLLHYLFLADINADAAFFAQVWNLHKLKIKGQATRSPSDMFYFDMLTQGVRGDLLADTEIASYGIDWENVDPSIPEPPAIPSWVGRPGPPPNLNEVRVDPPRESGLTALQVAHLHHLLLPLFRQFDSVSLTRRWDAAFAYASTCNPRF